MIVCLELNAENLIVQMFMYIYVFGYDCVYVCLSTTQIKILHTSNITGKFGHSPNPEPLITIPS